MPERSRTPTALKHSSGWLHKDGDEYRPPPAANHHQRIDSGGNGVYVFVVPVRIQT